MFIKCFPKDFLVLRVIYNSAKNWSKNWRATYKYNHRFLAKDSWSALANLSLSFISISLSLKNVDLVQEINIQIEYQFSCLKLNATQKLFWVSQIEFSD